MERKVSRRVTRLTAAALAVAAITASPIAGAGSVAGTGGATEVTQLANHVELVTSAIQNIKTVANTLQTVIHLKEVLRNLDPRVLAEIAGIPASDFDQLYTLNNDINGMLSAYRSLNDQLSNFQSGVSMTGLSPSQYLTAQVQAAQKYGGYYKRVLSSEQNALQNAISEQAGLSEDLARIHGDTGVVDSVKQMSGQLVQVRATNLSMLQQLQQANMLAAADKMANGNRVEQHNQAALQRYQQFIQNQQTTMQQLKGVNLPDPTKVDLTGQSSAGAGK